MPTLGVLSRLPRHDVAFIVVAGLPLTMILWGILRMALEGAGLELSAGNPVAVFLILLTTGLGPAIAYYFQVGLRAAGISHAIGCLALVAWATLVLFSAAAGWLAAVTVGTLGLLGGGIVLARWIAQARRPVARSSVRQRSRRPCPRRRTGARQAVPAPDRGCGRLAPRAQAEPRRQPGQSCSEPTTTSATSAVARRTAADWRMASGFAAHQMSLFA